MSKLYNLEKVNELADGDQDFVKAIVGTFLEEIPADIDLMTKAVAQNNPKEAYQYAHKMKPSFMLFGIDVVDKVKLLESWKEGEISIDEAKPAVAFVNEMAKLAIEQLQNDFK